MQQKIHELTEKIFQEGVQKGEQKGEEIAAAAKEKAERQLTDARAEAERIIAGARTQAEELKRNMQADIRLAEQQALSVVRQRIVDVVTATVDQPVSDALSDPALLADLIRQIAAAWIGGGEASGVEVLLPEAQRERLESALKAQAGSLLQKGLTVTFSPAIKAGMQVGRGDGGYKVSLSDADFQEFFKSFLRPRTRAFLFGE